MNRTFSGFLSKWLRARERRPLVIRGARQVGKTWLVRDLAERERRPLLEVNFERDPRFGRYFHQPDPRRVFDDIALALGRDAGPEDAILFLDEVQAAPEVLSKLRWFGEEMPDLAVVAAGSLLDFVLAEHGFSMPVGRIGYGFVEPLTFAEYLDAQGQQRLLDRLATWRPGDELGSAAHEMAVEWMDRFAMVGGMPGVVKADAGGAAAADCRSIQKDLVQTYRDDFAKYSGRLENRVLDPVLFSVVRSLGKKFVYSRVAEGVKLPQAKRALELLAMARLCQLIPHTAANGIPLAAQTNDRICKVALLDAGLAHGFWNTPAQRGFPNWNDLAPEIRAGLTEQLAAQELRATVGGPRGMGTVHHWRREGGRTGEIDYLVEVGGRILPVEVKSGAIGSMKSLHQFMFEKQLPLAIRLDRNPPSMQEVDLRTTQGNPVTYRLLNLPHYLTWRLPELAAEVG